MTDESKSFEIEIVRSFKNGWATIEIVIQREEGVNFKFAEVAMCTTGEGSIPYVDIDDEAKDLIDDLIRDPESDSKKMFSEALQAAQQEFAFIWGFKVVNSQPD